MHLANEILERMLTENLEVDVVDTIRTLTRNRTFNVASFLKYNYGHALFGMTDDEWLLEADAMLKICRL